MPYLEFPFLLDTLSLTLQNLSSLVYYFARGGDGTFREKLVRSLLVVMVMVIVMMIMMVLG